MRLIPMERLADLPDDPARLPSARRSSDTVLKMHVFPLTKLLRDLTKFLQL